MKKVLATVAVSTALILGGAVAASAAGIEVDGVVRIRGINIDTTIGTDKAAKNYYDQKVQVGFKSKPSDNLTGYIRLGSASTSTDNFNWDDGPATKAGSEMYIDEAWIDYKPTSFGLKAGRMHLNLPGNNFIDHRSDAPDSGILVYGDLAGTKVGLLTVKLSEGSALDDNSSDLDAYIVHLGRKFSDNFSGDVAYTLLKGGADDESSYFNGLAMSDLGLNATVKAGGLTVKGDVNLQFGTYSDNGTTAVDANGYAVQLNADYKIGKSTIGAMLAQGSGDDNSADNDNDTFLAYLFSTYRHNTLAGYALATPGSGKIGSGNTGLSNLTIMQLNASTSVTCPITGKPLSLFGALNFLQTTEDVTAANGAKTDDLGTELHAKAAWKLTSNLTYLVEGFYVMTDDAYTHGKSSMDIDDIYWLRHGITMKF
ncbi:MAG: hypothetical protein A2512_03480 [Deltaproteobacteria bacterium RIFOXYD12_FULL_56_24]|nr:MAG: hypothetical protein A2512_03480 [Deltaproteobacteria bacterium RIFOXYD12_FULL_56_24]